MKKLQNKKGETLVETLAAILLFTMASIVLYSMVTTAASMNTRVRRKSQEVQQQMVIAEQASGDEYRSDADLVLKIKNPKATGTINITEPVNVYRQNPDSLYTFLAK